MNMKKGNPRGSYWFRRSGYKESERYGTPKWHLPAKSYDPKGWYESIEAACGYKVDSLLQRPFWSRAKMLRGEVCKKCMAMYDDVVPSQEGHHERIDTAP